MAKKQTDEEFDEMMSVLNDLIGCFNDTDKIMDKIKKSGGYFITSHTKLMSHIDDSVVSERDSWEFEESTETIPYYDERTPSPIGNHSNVHAFNSEKAIYVGNDILEAKKCANKNIEDKKTLMMIGIDKGSDSIKKYRSLRHNIWEIVNNTEEINEFLETVDSDDIIAIFDMANDEFKKIADKFYDKLDRIESIRMRKLHLEGDIIITDPCYIIKHRDETTRPKWSDFHPYKSIYEYPDYDENTRTSVMFDEDSKKMDKACSKWDSENPDDHDLWSDYDLSRFGINNFIAHRTLYGDWSCTTFDENDNPIGEFCADGGEVGVFLLEEVLKYNPDFDYHKNRPWTTTYIKDFKGDVWFEKLDEETLIVRGEGNINFYTRQTGL